MKGLQKIKRKFPFMTLSLIIIISLLIHVNFAKAEEIEDINLKDVPFDIVILFPGQSATFSITQSTTFGIHVVIVISIFSRTLSANLTNISSSANGFWWITLFGFGIKTDVDYRIGTAPWEGESAQIDLGQGVNYAIVTGALYLTTSPEDPVSYDITVGS